jgi:hypothetical protein
MANLAIDHGRRTKDTFWHDGVVSGVRRTWNTFQAVPDGWGCVTFDTFLSRFIEVRCFGRTYTSFALNESSRWGTNHTGSGNSVPIGRGVAVYTCLVEFVWTLRRTVTFQFEKIIGITSRTTDTGRCQRVIMSIGRTQRTIIVSGIPIRRKRAFFTF